MTISCCIHSSHLVLRVLQVSLMSQSDPVPPHHVAGMNVIVSLNKCVVQLNIGGAGFQKSLHSAVICTLHTVVHLFGLQIASVLHATSHLLRWEAACSMLPRHLYVNQRWPH